jgi:SAM-dependent methyltransferase
VVDLLKLNIGCGPDLRHDYINIDIQELAGPNYIKHDLTKGLPDSIQANSVDVVYSCHSLEHFFPWHRDNLLVSILTKLKPGGTFRLVLPNFRSLAKAYLDGDWNFFGQALNMGQIAPLGTLCEVANFGAYQYSDGTNEHKSVYDAEYTIALLKTFGFTDVKEVEYDTSIDPPALERRIFSFVVEAKKPT